MLAEINGNFMGLPSYSHTLDAERHQAQFHHRLDPAKMNPIKT
jgi:hypothetical protein